MSNPLLVVFEDGKPLEPITIVLSHVAGYCPRDTGVGTIIVLGTRHMFLDISFEAFNSAMHTFYGV